MTTITTNKVSSNTNTTIVSSKTGFSLNYLGKIQREKILNHLAQGKTLKCHHRNCESFINNEEFSTLYQYKVHCHTSHKRYPIHPELPLIQMLDLEPRGNPWEEVVENETYLPLGSNKSDKELLKKYYNIIEEDQERDRDQMDLEEYT